MAQPLIAFLAVYDATDCIQAMPEECPLAEGARLVVGSHEIKLPTSISFFARPLIKHFLSAYSSIFALQAARAEQSVSSSPMHAFQFGQEGALPDAVFAARCVEGGKMVHAVLCFGVSWRSPILFASLDAMVKAQVNGNGLDEEALSAIIATLDANSLQCAGAEEESEESNVVHHDGTALIQRIHDEEAALWRFAGFWLPKKPEAGEDISCDSPIDADQPFPVALDVPWEGARSWIRSLRAVEKETSSQQYYGISPCRLCGCRNGSRQYSDKRSRVSWPSGFGHYVEAHNVRPSQWFIDYVRERHASMPLSCAIM